MSNHFLKPVENSLALMFRKPGYPVFVRGFHIRRLRGCLDLRSTHYQSLPNGPYLFKSTKFVESNDVTFYIPLFLTAVKRYLWRELWFLAIVCG